MKTHEKTCPTLHQDIAQVLFSPTAHAKLLLLQILNVCPWKAECTVLALLVAAKEHACNFNDKAAVPSTIPNLRYIFQRKIRFASACIAVFDGVLWKNQENNLFPWIFPTKYLPTICPMIPNQFLVSKFLLQFRRSMDDVPWSKTLREWQWNFSRGQPHGLLVDTRTFCNPNGWWIH